MSNNSPNPPTSNRPNPPTNKGSRPTPPLTKAQPKVASTVVRKPIQTSPAIPWYFYAGVLVVLVGGIAFFALSSAQTIKNTNPDIKSRTPISVDAAQLAKSGVTIAKGNPSAKVTMVEYSDFQCPACQYYFSNALGKLMTEFVDTGKVYYVYKPHPLSPNPHPKAMKAAVYSLCVRDQSVDSFWKLHDLLYQHQSDWEGADKDENTLWAGYATQAGANPTAVSSCVAANGTTYEGQINGNLSEAQSFMPGGRTYTPMIIVGNSVLAPTGSTIARYLQYFRDYLNDALNK